MDYSVQLRLDYGYSKDLYIIVTGDSIADIEEQCYLEYPAYEIIDIREIRNID